MQDIFDIIGKRATREELIALLRDTERLRAEAAELLRLSLQAPSDKKLQSRIEAFLA